MNIAKTWYIALTFQLQPALDFRRHYAKRDGPDDDCETQIIWTRIKKAEEMEQNGYLTLHQNANENGDPR